MIPNATIQQDRAKIQARRTALLEQLIDETLLHRSRAGDTTIDIIVPRIAASDSLNELADRYRTAEAGWQVSFDDLPPGLDPYQHARMVFKPQVVAPIDTPPQP